MIIGQIDVSPFECLVRKDEKFRNLRSAEIQDLYPKSYAIIAYVGNVYDFSIDEPSDITPLTQRTEEIFKRIEKSKFFEEEITSIYELMLDLATVYITWQDNKYKNSKLLLIQSISRDDRISRVASNMIERLMSYSRRMYIRLV